VIDRFHAQPITPIYERRPPLWFLDEVTEEMRLVGVVETLDAALGYDAAVVGL
jgi:hypothetical protein